MRRWRVWTRQRLLTLIVVCAVGCSQAPPSEVPAGEPAMGGSTSSIPEAQDCGRAEVLVLFRKGVGDDEARRMIADAHASVVREYPTLNGYALAIPDGRGDQAIAALASHPEVARVAPNRCNRPN
jgi:hypothetical protein